MRSPLAPLLSFQVVLTHASAVYDYVILGGGTAGLVLANRLSENPNVTVAVVEAGSSVEHNPNVTQIENFFSSLGTSIDWQYKTQPQKFTQNRVLTYHSGKALGGSSTINGATYIRAQKAQIDAWEQLGNTGWNWDSLLPYYKKSEQFQPPTPELVAKGAAYEASVHGLHGHVHVGWSNLIQDGDAQQLLNETSQNLGIPYKRDQSDGNVHGFSVFPSTIISNPGIRADAARNYLYAIQNRPNLHVLSNTLAEKILWAKQAPAYGKGISASGVQVRQVSASSSVTLTVRREVIVSAGTHKSSVILENSGVGNKNILSAKGVTVKLDLPSVGENFQDQSIVTVAASAQSNWTGYTPFVTFATASDLFGKNTSAVASYVLSQIPAYASKIAAQANSAVSAAVVRKQLRIQADLIFNKSTPCAEIIYVPTNTSLTAVIWDLLPFSRGSVHLSSTDAASTPLINPNFLMLDWDAIAWTATANLARKSFHTAPIGKFVGANTLPNNSVVPAKAGISEWLPWLEENYNPNYHPVGSCAMMSKELGGVVDPELRVYGTTNVRVVDASVLPFQVDGHLTSTIYAVAERAADIIKGAPLL